MPLFTLSDDEIPRVINALEHNHARLLATQRQEPPVTKQPAQKTTHRKRA
jgi:hypothetical protein